MIEGFLFVLTLVTAFGCGLIAGVFVAFSTFVIRALARLVYLRLRPYMSSDRCSIVASLEPSA
jgi:uncharacterized membrane protein